MQVYLDFFGISLPVSDVSEALLECDRFRMRGGKDSEVVFS